MESLLTKITKKDKEQQELVNTGLGLACVGLGLMFALFPGFMNNQAGFNVERGPGRNLLIRLVGMRDLAFGIGILSNRTKPKEVRLWLNLLALIGGSDVLTFGLTLPKARYKFKVLLAMLASAIVMVLALRNRE
jgi:hypothetical protein